MHRRCRGYSEKDTKDYVSKGIKVCNRWSEYSAFLADMGECPDGLTLDRIDNSKGYRPDNCRWADQVTQSNNRRNVRLFSYKGESLSLTNWGKKLGIGQPTLHYRFRSGWSVEKMLSTSPEEYKAR